MVDLYFCNDCRKFFRLSDKHIKNRHVQDWVDCDLCGSEKSASRIHDIDPSMQNWIYRGTDICFALTEKFLRNVWSAQEDNESMSFEEWIESANNWFKLDMDAIREAVNG